jgi:hypothetical protein
MGPEHVEVVGRPDRPAGAGQEILVEGHLRERIAIEPGNHFLPADDRQLHRRQEMAGGEADHVALRRPGARHLCRLRGHACVVPLSRIQRPRQNRPEVELLRRQPEQRLHRPADHPPPERLVVTNTRRVEIHVMVAALSHPQVLLLPRGQLLVRDVLASAVATVREVAEDLAGDGAVEEWTEALERISRHGMRRSGAYRVLEGFDGLLVGLGRFANGDRESAP